MERKRTLLIVEDEETILFSLQRLLELTGKYETIIARNGREALQRIGSQIPDMIISDILMPEMDGLAFCRTVRENELTRVIPFIFLTGRKEMMKEGLEAGADDFILKPFVVDEVVVKIDAIFRRVDQAREKAMQFEGSLRDQPLDEVLAMCHQQSMSGRIHLQNQGQNGTIYLVRGEIESAEYGSKKDDQALDVLRTWRSGVFAIRSEKMRIKSDSFERQLQSISEEKLRNPVEIAKDTWWIGYRNPESLLQINVYLRRFQAGKRTINMIIDPGSPIDLPQIERKARQIIGDLSNVHFYTLNHPDPDVCMNALEIARRNPRAICLTTEENWRLISHFGLNPRSIKLINTFKNWQTDLVTGHRLYFIPSPFCHSRGAFLIYDVQTRILFTGDLFAGISDASRIQTLFGDQMDWHGIRTFHQVYMPSRAALRFAIEWIRKLDPAPLTLAPQHGNIIQGDLISRLLEQVYDLEVGSDLLELNESASVLRAYEESCNEILRFAENQSSAEQIRKQLVSSSEIPALCSLQEGRIQKIYSRPHLVFELMIHALCEGQVTDEVNKLKSMSMKIATRHGLPAPSLDWDQNITLSQIPRQLFDNQE